jgi:uncharacterized protein (TIGR03437 family)
MKSARLLHFGLIGVAMMRAVSAQTWDTSGNGLLSGNYYFREVIISSSEALSLYGNIVFNSASGTYTINAVGYDCNSQSCSASPVQTSGAYSIAGSGFGFLSNQILASDTIGSVGANGVFVGSATETGTYDLLIAAPIAGQGTGTLQGSYALSYLYPVAQTPYGALLGMTSNGAGGIGSVSVAGYASSPSPINQTIGGVKYFVSNNAFVVTFPNSSTALVTGQEYMYSTPDGSFVFGGSPQDFDMIVGVRTTGASSTNSALNGLYYEAGMEIDDSSLSTTGESFLDTFYGAFTASNSTIVGHQRRQIGGAAAYGYVYHDTYSAPSGNTYTDVARSEQYILSNGVRIGVGLGPFPALSVALAAPPVNNPGGGAMFLNPMSAVNSASYAPFTSGISSGELITLTGSNLGPAGFAIPTKSTVPTTVDGVQVTINGIPAPILEAGANEILVQVPFETTAATAQIQVSYKGAVSNTISTLVNLTTPGIFTNPVGGVNRATAYHPNGTLVNPAHPAKVNEVVSVYLTGLGDVSPTVVNGSVGPTITPSVPINMLAFYIDSIAATPTFVGLAPGLPAIYELKITIPAGVATGDVFLDVAGPDSYSTQALLSVTSTTPTSAESPEARKSRMPRQKGSYTPPRVGPRRTFPQ